MPILTWLVQNYIKSTFEIVHLQFLYCKTEKLYFMFKMCVQIVKYSWIMAIEIHSSRILKILLENLLPSALSELCRLQFYLRTEHMLVLSWMGVSMSQCRSEYIMGVVHLFILPGPATIWWTINTEQSNIEIILILKYFLVMFPCSCWPTWDCFNTVWCRAWQLWLLRRGIII